MFAKKVLNAVKLRLNRLKSIKMLKMGYHFKTEFSRRNIVLDASCMLPQI